MLVKPASYLDIGPKLIQLHGLIEDHKSLRNNKQMEMCVGSLNTPWLVHVNTPH